MNFKKYIDNSKLWIGINPYRLDICIRIMKGVVAKQLRFCMMEWQDGYETCQTLEHLHECGSAACFGGYLALDAEFKSLGGGVVMGSNGAPLFKGWRGYVAVNAFLGRSLANVGKKLCDPDSELYEECDLDIKAQDVLERLEYLRSKL